MLGSFSGQIPTLQEVFNTHEERFQTAYLSKCCHWVEKGGFDLAVPLEFTSISKVTFTSLICNVHLFQFEVYKHPFWQQKCRCEFCRIVFAAAFCRFVFSAFFLGLLLSLSNIDFAERNIEHLTPPGFKKRKYPLLFSNSSKAFC